MPTYDYRCNACGHTFDEFQTMSEPELRKCPKCGKLKLERLIGAGAGFVFKGSGYYVTDYRSKGYEEAKKKDSAASSSESTKAKTDGAAKKPKKPSKGSDGGGSKSAE